MRFEVGDRVVCIIGSCEGVTGTIFKINGVEVWCRNWSDGKDGYLRKNLLKITRKGVTMKDAKWAIKYDRDEDPVEFFKTKPKAQKRLEVLLDDYEVDKEEIYLFQVGKVWKVERPIDYELVEVK